MRDLIRRRPWTSAVAGGLLAGAAIGLATPPPPADSWSPDSGAWELPTPAVVERVDPDSLGQVRRAPFWDAGAGADGGPAGTRAALWRLAGIITDPRIAALVAADGAKVVALGVGDALPDGATIVSIQPGEINYERAGCRFMRKLYETAEHAGECAGGAPANEEAED